MSTSIRRTQRGWEAVTDCPVPHTENLVLRISTYKREGLGLITTAVAHRAEEGRVTHLLYADYRKTLLLDPRARCTEAAVQKQHEGQMGRLEGLLREVAAHYKLEGVAA